MNGKRLISTIKKISPLFSLMVVLIVLLVACSQAAAPNQSVPVTAPTAAPTATTAAPAATMAPTTAPAAAEPVINVATDAKLGKILVDGKGMTLYIFTKDAPDKSNCAGGCLKAWPPLLTQGSPKAGDGVDQSLLGSTSMADGSKIVTYNKMPLYYWAKDNKPGDTTGQGVNNVWFVVAPDGKPVGMTASAPAAEAVMVNVATDPKLGKILVDSKGMTLYMFKKDEPNKSNCTAGCLKAWPPLLAAGDVKAGDGVDQSLLGTAAMADGSKIVTYNKMPLYYWAKDTKPGDTTGQDVNNVWFVVAPDGKPVETAGASAQPADKPAASGDVVVNIATDPKLGKILVDSKGMVLYMFKKDEPNKSNCTGGCLKAWPPFQATSSVKAGDGVDQSLLGTAALADGTQIVTYNQMPLYYWQGDTKAGDATGQGVNNVWYVVAPDGKPVTGDTPTGY